MNVIWPCNYWPIIATFSSFFLINAHYEPLGRITIVGQSVRISFFQRRARQNQRLEEEKTMMMLGWAAAAI
jgi:hypothetical protein